MKYIPALVALFFIIPDVKGEVLYSSGFESTNQIPSIIFGRPELSPVVVHRGKSLEFEARLSYEQIRIPISTNSSSIYIRFYAKTQNLTNSDYSFTMLMDTPEVRNASFHGGNNRLYTFPGNLSRTFQDGKVYLVETFVDFEQNTWELKVDGSSLGINSINASTVSSIRFSMSPWTGAANSNALNTKVFIDSLLIFVPDIPPNVMVGKNLGQGRDYYRSKFRRNTRYGVSLKNSGDVGNRFVANHSKNGSRRIKVTFLDPARRNVTNELASSGYTTQQLAPGETESIKAIVKTKRGNRNRRLNRTDVFSLRVDATDSTQKDRAKVKLEKKG